MLTPMPKLILGSAVQDPVDGLLLQLLPFLMQWARVAHSYPAHAGRPLQAVVGWLAHCRCKCSDENNRSIAHFLVQCSRTGGCASPSCTSRATIRTAMSLPRSAGAPSSRCGQAPNKPVQSARAHMPCRFADFHCVGKDAGLLPNPPASSVERRTHALGPLMAYQWGLQGPSIG